MRTFLTRTHIGNAVAKHPLADHWTMPPIQTTLALHWTDKCLFVETLASLTVAKAAVVLLPFRWVARGFGKEQPAATWTFDPVNWERILRIRYMVNRVSKNVPWSSKCLDQVIAAKLMLARRDLPTTIYFGVRTSSDGELMAHAWLRSGAQFVTGFNTHRTYKVINTFSNEAR